MKVFYFRKIKVKINPNPLDLSLSVESKLVTNNLNGSYSIKCNNLLEYKKTLNFFRRYIFLGTEEDYETFKIYIPKGYILTVMDT